MRRRLPPLKAIRAFEAAARHQSFVEAADELAVTPSAVSQQVKQLEDWLGRPMFRRLPRGLVLTDAAKSYLPSLTEALDRIDQATRAVSTGPQGRALTVTCLSSFGAQWLAPRLHRFDMLHPDIDVMLATFDRVVDLETEDVDLAIRYGVGAYPNLRVEELMRDDLGVVCSPDLRDHPEYPIRSYQDLCRHTLLHDADARGDSPLAWDKFLERLNESGIDASRGPRFSDSHMVIQACIAGRGVMIGRSALISDAMASGVLVAPFGMPIQSEASYRLLMLPGAEADPRIAAFRLWLYEELGREPPEAGGVQR